MIELARGLSFVAYRYEGGPLRFTVPFPFLKREHIRALVGDPASPRTIMPTWIDSTTVEIPSQEENLNVPYDVAFRRFTPILTPAVDFQNGAMLPAKQLNAALAQLLYAQQEITEYGLDGNGLPGAGLPGGGNGNIPDIQTIIDQVIRSPAFQILQERIPLVDRNAELIMAELLRSNEYFDTKRDYGDKISSAVTRISLVESSSAVTAEQYTELFARITTLDQDVSARFLEVNTAIATEREARVTSITDLYAQITSEVGTIVAQYVAAIEVRVNDVEAAVEEVEGAQAVFGQSLAATNASLLVFANATTANTQWQQLFASQFGSGTTGTSVAAAVKTQIATKATPAEALAIANTSVAAFAGGQFASLQQSYTAYVNSNDGRWNATWALRVEGGDPNNPVVGGIALSAYPGGSDFVVSANRFAMVFPGDSYVNRKFPFVIGMVGGVSTVGITGQLLVDGSITANKITANSLSAISANLGTVNGGTFKTHTLDSNGGVIDALEFRFEATNVGTWPLWIGSGVKNENNAVFWVDRFGNAGFKGRVSAPNIVGQFQAATAVTWTGSRTLTQNAGGTFLALDYQELTQFTLQAPLRVGEVHTPSVSLSVSCNTSPGLDLIVQELRASIWTEIGRYDTPFFTSSYMVNGGGGNEIYNYTSPLKTTSATVLAVGEPTASARQFRVLARHRNVVYTSAGGGDRSQLLQNLINATAVSGFVFGLR